MSETEQQEEAFTEAKLLEAIENQLSADDPPAALATLNKLTLVGYPLRKYCNSWR